LGIANDVIFTLDPQKFRTLDGAGALGLGFMNPTSTFEEFRKEKHIKGKDLDKYVSNAAGIVKYFKWLQSRVHEAIPSGSDSGTNSTSSSSSSSKSGDSKAPSDGPGMCMFLSLPQTDFIFKSLTCSFVYSG
jgi:hypothetical protein